MAELPSYDLEIKAADERRRLHQALAELRAKVREDLDVKRRIRERLGPTSGIAAVLGLALGYSMTGLFVRH